MEKRTQIYQDGNTLRTRIVSVPTKDEEILFIPKSEKKPEKQPYRLNWARLGLFLVLSTLTLAFAVMCFSFLELNASVNASRSNIYRLEKQLAQLKADNQLTENRMNAQIDLAEVYEIATEQLCMVYPDANAQVNYSEQVREYVIALIEKNGIPAPKKLLINPAGTWTFGGPSADCGLTGRKIVCDQYGGYAPVGGGAFSGKDPSKVDRSGCYAARRIAVDMVRKHNFESCTVQIAYAIGVSSPVSVYAYGVLRDGSRVDVSTEVVSSYDLTPRGIIDSLGLLEFNYGELAGGNHMMAFV